MTAILLETVEQRLSRLIDSFQAQLLQWSSDGTLAAAVQHVLLLTTSEELGALEALLGSWATGDTATLPQIEFLSGEQLTGAAGAYASSTQTVYFNAEWFEQSSDEAILFVLTEEFGHWLEDQLKGVDTPGDEGAALASELLGTPDLAWQLAPSLPNESDSNWTSINNQFLQVELSATVATPVVVRRFDAYSVRSFAALGDIVYFTVGDGLGHSFLWQSDGTSAGTRTVSGVNDATWLSVANNTLWFASDDGVSGYELWKINDPDQGPMLVKDINISGTTNYPGSYPYGFISLGETVLFGASDGLSGFELWKTDGTSNGTELVIDINSGHTGSYPYGFTAIGDIVFFSAYDDIHGQELWKTDGTQDGTVFIKDICPGTRGSYIAKSFASIGNTVYFRANDGSIGYELWKTDGTEEGTVLVKDICTLSMSGVPNAGSDLYGLTFFGDALFFSANDGVHGNELWKTDGTKEGTVLFKDIALGSASSQPYGFIVVGKSLYFTANGELWKTDGTPEGTVQIADINSANAGSFPYYYTLVGNSLFFSANDGSGYQLFSLDVSSEFLSTFAIAADPASVDKFEGSGTDPLAPSVTIFSYTVTRTGDISEACEVTWKTAGFGLNAANATDFLGGTLPSGVVSFAANQTTATITVYVAGDTAEEGNETFKIVLSDPPTGSALSKSTATSIIQNDDGTYLSIAALQASLHEGNTGSTQFTFTVTRSGDTTDTSEVDWIVSSGSPNSASVTDFFGAGANFPKGSLMFMAGETSKSIAIDVAGDASFEANETFLVSLVNQIDASIIEGSGSAAGTILNDDAPPPPPAPPVISISGSTSKQEGDSDVVTTYTFTVSRSGDISNGCFVDWAVSGSGASPANAADFVGGLLPAGTLNFAPNQTSQTISIQVKGDLEFESNESFVVTLSNPPSGVSLGTSTATGTINNDDSPPVLSITSFSADKLEGNGPGSTAFTFRVSRTGGDLSNSSSVTWTVSGTVVNEADFAGGVFPTGTVNFAADSSFQDITINVSGDINLEGDELFTVSLSGADGATIGVESASGIIRNDDTLPKLSIATTGTSDQGEGYSGFTPFTFTVVRSGDTTNTSSVSWAVTGLGINPASASDFQGGTFPSGTVQFAAWATTATITVNVVADQAFEANESFLVTLSNPQRSTITNATATGIIRNDDLIGTSNADTIIGNTFSDFIDGRKGQDSLTGSLGSDIFGFRFGQSLIKSPDRITDFEFGQDKIDLFTSTGAALPAPTTFFRAADNANATSLTQLASAVFADADGFNAGNQALAANGAVLVNATNASIAGTYLFVNNGTASFGSSADLVVNVSGYTGILPSFGSINPSQVFI